MNLLLDTHTLLWFATDDAELSASARAVIENPSNTVYASICSYWEIAIKKALGRLQFEHDPQAIFEAVSAVKIDLLNLTIEHVQAIVKLPQHHRDPFDRILIAQSLSHDMTIVTRDKHFSEYDIAVYW